VKTKGLTNACLQQRPAAGAAAAKRTLYLMRDKQKILPLRREQKVLVVDRVIDSQSMPTMSGTIRRCSGIHAPAEPERQLRGL